MKEQLLKDLTKLGLKNSHIEIELEMPKNSLSNFISGKKELPNKWVDKIKTFIQARLEPKTEESDEQYFQRKINEILRNPENAEWLLNEIHELEKNGIIKTFSIIPPAIPDHLLKIDAYLKEKGLKADDLISGYESAQVRLSGYSEAIKKQSGTVTTSGSSHNLKYLEQRRGIKEGVKKGNDQPKKED